MKLHYILENPTLILHTKNEYKFNHDEPPPLLIIDGCLYVEEEI